jgi:hypothetical protein
MPIKFKIQNGLRVNTTDVLNSTGEFIGGRLLPTSTESATSITTGALVVPGGAGVAENLFVGGAINNITFNQPANTSSITIGSNITLGFPNSLSFPLSAGVDGYVLTTDGNGVLRWDAISSVLNMPTASTTVLGGVKIGSGINVALDGTISVQPTQGPKGDKGDTGDTGPQGPAGVSVTASETLVWSTSGNYRTLTGYKENDVTNTVRVAEFAGSTLRLTLATFTPTVTAAATPGATLNWDIPATGFTVTVDNPTDVPDEYISSVASITQVTGSISTTLENYTAGAYSNTPAGGVDWTRSFTTDNTTSYIRSASTTAAGGSASGTVAFNYYNGTTTASWSTSSTFSVSWNTVSHSVSISALTGKTFLDSYTSTSYTPSTSNVLAANRSFSIAGVGGTVSSTSSSGTLTFTNPINHSNKSTTRYITLTTTAFRPATVTGTAYTVILGPVNSNDVATSASFTYPSFWLWTSSVSNVPTRSTIISGTAAKAGVTTLGDQVKTLTTQSITNSDANPRAFWFVVRSSASQPTSFKTGASAGLLSDVSYTNGGIIALSPDTQTSDYVAENYRLYGFTLQSGSTYVSIS